MEVGIPYGRARYALLRTFSASVGDENICSVVAPELSGWSPRKLSPNLISEQDTMAAKERTARIFVVNLFIPVQIRN